MLAVFRGGITARHSATVCFSTSLGFFEVEAGIDGVTRVRLAGKGRPREAGSGGAMAMARGARSEILAYLAGELRTFTIPVLIEGTPFQRDVWEQVASIPFGKTRTYRELAIAVDRPLAVRAVGAACGANRVPVIIPCHRVVGSNGSLGGFGGGVAMKKALLEIEKAGASGGGEATLASGQRNDAPRVG